MGERLGLRLRFALFFAALALGGAAVFGAALWLGHSRAGGPADGYVIAGLVAGFGLAGLALWIGLLFDENVARPILALSAELQTRARSEVAAEIDPRPARYLGALAPAAQAIHTALEETRDSLERAVAEKLSAMARDKALLEALLRELADGIVVMSADGRILLYNRVAADLLGPLGLDRPLNGFLRTDPVMDAVGRLENGAGEEPAAFLTTASADGRILSGTVSNVARDTDRIAHVLLFRDMTEDLRTHGDLERLLHETVEGARRPASAMGAVLDVLESATDMTGEDRQRFNGALREELGRLSTLLADTAGKQAALSVGHWPIGEIPVQQIFEAIQLRVPAPVAVQPTQQFALCDGYAVTEILVRVIAGLCADVQRRGLSLYTDPTQPDICLCLEWTGPALPLGQLERDLAAPIAPAYGSYTGRDALEAHRSDVWTEATAGGGRIVLPLRPADAPHLRSAAGALEFYDFNLPDHVDPDLGARALADLSFVVFDTETTGLDPARDEVVQIAGIRILGGRLLRGETFDHLVNPGRPIPLAATGIHRISTEMVAGAARFPEVASRFSGFVEGSVLVAHNAAFDMAFLARLAANGGPAIGAPALCTARLSARLFDHAADHTLDALAARFGIEIAGHHRHTALGDAIATAEILLKMLPLLEARNIRTLQDALDFQGMA